MFRGGGPSVVVGFLSARAARLNETQPSLLPSSHLLSRRPYRFLFCGVCVFTFKMNDLKAFALIAQKAGMKDKALGLWSRYLEENDDDFGARCNYALLLSATDKPKAIEEYKRSLGKTKHDGAVRMNLSALLIAENRPEESLEYCDDPYNLNVALRLLGRGEEAVERSWRMIGIERECFVVCVKWGNKYDAEYVNRLYRGVQRHLDRRHRFVCFTDDAEGLDDGIETERFPDENLHTWWLKSTIFVAKLLRGRVLYLDLDTVVVGSLDALFDSHTSRTTITVLGTEHMRQENYRRNGYNSSVILWNAPAHAQIYTELVDNFDKISSVVYKFDHWLEMLFGTDLDVIRVGDGELVGEYNPTMNEESCVLSSQTSLVTFPLRPKPHEILSEGEIGWIMKEWKRR